MPSWRDEYLSALEERDKKEKANKTLYDSYTKLANHTAQVQAAPVVESSKLQDESGPSSKFKDLKVGGNKGGPSSSSQSDPIAGVRQDLAEAQRSRDLIETKLQGVTDELNKLKIQTSLDTKRIRELTKEKTTLVTGLRDRDEELKGKSKLLEDLHDEAVSLTLQLNLAEERSQKLQGENKELVDRWMARMGKEADAMNDESKFS